MKKRFTEEQIIGAVKRLEKGEPTRELSRELGVTMQTLYGWRRKFGGGSIARQPDLEKGELKKMVGPEVKRDSAVKVVERFQVSRRRACRILSLHQSTLQYKPKGRDDEEVKAKMKMFASRFRRFGRPRIHNELRKSGDPPKKNGI